MSGKEQHRLSALSAPRTYREAARRRDPGISDTLPGGELGQSDVGIDLHVVKLRLEARRGVGPEECHQTDDGRQRRRHRTRAEGEVNQAPPALLFACHRLLLTGGRNWGTRGLWPGAIPCLRGLRSLHDQCCVAERDPVVESDDPRGVDWGSVEEGTVRGPEILDDGLSRLAPSDLRVPPRDAGIADHGADAGISSDD